MQLFLANLHPFHSEADPFEVKIKADHTQLHPQIFRLASFDIKHLLSSDPATVEGICLYIEVDIGCIWF